MTPSQPVAGAVAELLPGVVRVVAPNPGVMTGPGTNSYLVGEHEVAVIDPGPDDPAHVEKLLAVGAGRIKSVLVTHTHPDHAPAAGRLAERAGAEIIGYGARDGFVPGTTAGDGFTLDVGGRRLRAMHTPGHASNHLCWLLEDAGVVFSGDHVMEGSTVVIAPPDGDMAAYLASLRRLQELDPAPSAIAPGHGGLITEPGEAIAAYISHRLAREQAASDALRLAGDATVDELLGAVYSDVPAALHPVARWSLWAHLRKLGEEGSALCDNPSDIEAPWRAVA